MYYITGDTHGDFDRLLRFCDRIGPTKDDTMIILGDAAEGAGCRLNEIALVGKIK